MEQLEPKPITPAFWAAVIVIPAVVVLVLIWALLNPQSLLFLNSKEAIDISFRVPGEPVTRSLSQFRGRVLAVTIWDANCPDCQSQIGILNELSTRYSREGLMSIALTPADEAAIRRIASFQGMSVLAGNMERGQAEALPADRPYTYLIDREGFARLRFKGVRDADKLDKTVQKLLEQ
ncbi:redoxin family protein [uncultured Paludibaculum sp.]|uniref:peroxiredoxin family protein n=1 Tax=uncultured Paludibaculum sp. TaxID=1765020 RepID=UPI002AAAF7FB|nr:redoxin family protein [uncultured Paludibaculum sp.]